MSTLSRISYCRLESMQMSSTNCCKVSDAGGSVEGGGCLGIKDDLGAIGCSGARGGSKVEGISVSISRSSESESAGGWGIEQRREGGG